VVTNIRGAGMRSASPSESLRRRRRGRVSAPLSIGRRIDLARKGKVRRAKLFYLRGRKGKAAKVGEREKLGGDGA
jgi:ribosomal protein L19